MFKSLTLKSSLGSLLINSGNKVLVFISGVLLVRILGNEQYGIYSYILSFIYVLIIPAEYGVSTLVVRETAKGIADENRNGIIGIWRWSLKVTILLCGIILIFSFLGLLWGGNYFSYLEKIAFIWALSLLPFQATIYLASAALRGLKYIILGQLPELIVLPGAFAVLFLIVLLVSPMSLTVVSSLLLRFIATVIAFLFSVFFLLKKTPKSILVAKPVTQGKNWALSAMPIGLSSGLGMVKSRVTVLLMGIFVTAIDIGTFQIAISTAALAGLVLQANNAAFAPQFASLYAQNKKEELQKLVTTSTRLMFAFNLIISIIFVVFGRFLLSFVFGLDLVDAYPSVLILLLGHTVSSLVGSVIFLLNMTGHENDVMRVVGITSLLNAFFVLILTPIFGIIGGAVSTTFSLIVAQVLMLHIVQKRIGIVSHVFVKK